jgi:hypothetical protein
MGWGSSREEIALDFALACKAGGTDGIIDWLDTKRRVW